MQTTWQLLDYLAVDYGGAVKDGKVISASEYAEMREFSASAADKIAGLPASPAKAQLVAEGNRFAALIGAKASPRTWRRRRTRWANICSPLIRSRWAPGKPPDLARGDQLFQQNCASCHGARGDAQTAMARQLNPPPIAFADRDRAKQRSPFALYQVINQGLEGTAMQSFAQLPDADKWALAFRASRFAYPDSLARQGQPIWDDDPAIRARCPTSMLSAPPRPQLNEAQIGAGKAGPVIADVLARASRRCWPRRLPASDLPASAFSKALAAYRAGNQAEAKSLALSAYLDGFEPVEAALSARNATLLAQVEQRMGELRASIAANRDPSEVASRIADVRDLVDEAEASLSPDQASNASAFLGAFTILLREGLEALLIVVAMLAFLNKADRPELTRPVHFGWTSALAAGVADMVGRDQPDQRQRREPRADRGVRVAAGGGGPAVRRHLDARQGAGRPVAALHSRKAGQRLGQRFALVPVLARLHRRLSRGLRDDPVLHRDGRGRRCRHLIAGAIAGFAALAAIAVAMLRFSRRLPIGKFFTYSSALVAVLAIVLAGKGVAALQEAGLIAIHPLAGFPRISLLGIFPTLQGILAQVATLLALLIGFGANRRSSRPLAPA